MVQMGVEHPLTYLNSFLINTVDFWYPNAVVDGYRDAYGRSSYFDYKVSEPGEEIVLPPGVHRYYEAISLDPQVQKNALSVFGVESRLVSHADCAHIYVPFALPKI